MVTLLITILIFMIATTIAGKHTYTTEGPKQNNDEELYQPQKAFFCCFTKPQLGQYPGRGFAFDPPLAQSRTVCCVVYTITAKPNMNNAISAILVILRVAQALMCKSA